MTAEQQYEMVQPENLRVGDRVWTFTHVQEDKVDRVFIYTIAAIEPPDKVHPDEWDFTVEPVESHKERTLRVPTNWFVPRLT